jgi:hypothetical protein
MRSLFQVVGIFVVMLAAGGAVAEDYTLYFGNLHAHTSYSDGKLTPADAYDYARNTAKLDFMTVTDHMEALTTEEWANEHSMADAANVDGKFVAQQGYEWGSPPFNHLNFWLTEKIWDVDTYFVSDITKFWKPVSKLNPKPIVQFNHPDWYDDRTDYPVFNWNWFEYYAPMDDIALLIEIKDPGQEKSFQLSLDMGWHATPVFNQDNHDADWGTENDCRAALWMTALTREGMWEAVRSGRTYSTCDKNASLMFKGNGQWMGSRVGSSPVSLTWELSDPDTADTFDKVELITNAGVVLKTDEPKTNKVTGSFKATPASKSWYYLRAKMNNGAMLYSAPIFFEEIPDAGMPADSGGDVINGSEPSEGSSGCSCSILGID